MDVDDLFEAKSDSCVVLRVHVQPGAGRSAVVGRHGDSLKVRVSAPPTAGRANEAGAELLAQTFSLDAAQVALVSGPKSRSKAFRLDGLDMEAFRRELERAVIEAVPGANPRSPGRSRS